MGDTYKQRRTGPVALPAERVMVGLEAGHGRVGAEGILPLVLGR